MQQIKSRPPNYEKIVAVLPGACRPGVVFAYAPDVYVPSGRPLPDELLAHEHVHIMRQNLMGVEAWWDRYLSDPEFRYYEEVIAHASEYHWLIRNAPNRNVRRMALKRTAARLANNLYQGSRSASFAAEDIKRAVAMLSKGIAA